MLFSKLFFSFLDICKFLSYMYFNSISNSEKILRKITVRNSFLCDLMFERNDVNQIIKLTKSTRELIFVTLPNSKCFTSIQFWSGAAIRSKTQNIECMTIKTSINCPKIVRFSINICQRLEDYFYFLKIAYVVNLEHVFLMTLLFFHSQQI